MGLILRLGGVYETRGDSIREEQRSSSLVSKAKAREIADSKRFDVKRLKEEGKSRKEVAETLGISKSSVQRFWV